MAASKIELECKHGQKSNKIACTGLQNRPRGPPAAPANRGLPRACLPCASAGLARNSEFREGSAETHHTSQPLCLRGPRLESGIPRGSREHSVSHHLGCACAVLARPFTVREPTAKAQLKASCHSLSAACGAEFRQPREARGDSALAWVWFGLRVRFGLVPSVNFYCYNNSNALRLLTDHRINSNMPQNNNIAQ